MVKFLDAEGGIVGRIASTAAKALLKGESVVIVNAEKAVVTGSKAFLVAHYRQKRHVGHARSGPFFPRRPDRMLRRAVRGMLPRKKFRGREAFHRLDVHVGVPKALTKETKFERVVTRRGRDRFMSLGDIAKLLGATY